MLFDFSFIVCSITLEFINSFSNYILLCPAIVDFLNFIDHGRHRLALVFIVKHHELFLSDIEDERSVAEELYNDHQLSDVFECAPTIEDSIENVENFCIQVRLSIKRRYKQ